MGSKGLLGFGQPFNPCVQRGYRSMVVVVVVVVVLGWVVVLVKRFFFSERVKAVFPTHKQITIFFCQSEGIEVFRRSREE